MPRFFRRLSEGVFDLDDLRLRTRELAAFVREAAVHYRFDASNARRVDQTMLLLQLMHRVRLRSRRYTSCIELHSSRRACSPAPLRRAPNLLPGRDRSTARCHPAYRVSATAGGTLGVNSAAARHWLASSSVDDHTPSASPAR